VVFVPDITYRDGFPGQSAYDAVVSGTQAMVERYPFIDRHRMGLQGQSWGGYQIAYLVTQTNMFRAAMAGAPVSNMVSAYGGIRWGSGMSRQFQYEQTQSRIGGTLWEKPFRYIENSPVFFADKIETPLLMMHNDDDGAVPWYQGIELYTAMRRLEKPVWMLVYNGEAHNLREWPNRVDLSIRMYQFFDHYLKDEPAPVWLKEGRPYIDKEKTDAYELME
jgi:dipeptidyl aminopeptidase/acylaminoacyl peptidase